MAHVTIVYHSGFGHTQEVAEAVTKGAASVDGIRVSQVSVEDLPAPDAQGEYAGRWDELEEADALVMGCPTYMGSVSAGLKTFFESASKIWLRQGWKDKLAAGFTNSASWSGDKLNTLQDIHHFAMQHGMLWVGLDLPGGYNSSKGSPEDLNRVGSFSGLMTQANADEGPKLAPPPADLATAEHFGARVARAALRWTAG